MQTTPAQGTAPDGVDPGHVLPRLDIPQREGFALQRTPPEGVGYLPDGARKVVIHTAGSVATAPITGGLFVLRDAVGRTSDLLTLG